MKSTTSTNTYAPRPAAPTPGWAWRHGDEGLGGNVARHAGTDVVITSGRTANVILRVAVGEAMGTRFAALEGRPESRKQVDSGRIKPVGGLIIDEGAVRALCQDGRSLLPAGIIRVEGHSSGDTVTVLDPSHRTGAWVGCLWQC